MFCKYCGNNLTVTSRFCSKCGKPVIKSNNIKNLENIIRKNAKDKVVKIETASKKFFENTKSITKKSKDSISSKITSGVVLRTILRVIVLPVSIFLFVILIFSCSLKDSVFNDSTYIDALSKSKIYTHIEKMVIRPLPAGLRPLITSIVNEEFLKRNAELIIREMFLYIKGEKNNSVAKISLQNEKNNLVFNMNSLFDKIERSMNFDKLDIFVGENLKKKLYQSNFSNEEKILLEFLIKNNFTVSVNTSSLHDAKQMWEYVKNKSIYMIIKEIPDEYVLKKDAFDVKILCINVNVLDKIKIERMKVNRELSKYAIYLIISLSVIFILSLFGPKENILFWLSLPLIFSGIISFVFYYKLYLDFIFISIQPFISFLVLPFLHSLRNKSIYVFLIGMFMVILFILIKVKYRMKFKNTIA